MAMRKRGGVPMEQWQWFGHAGHFICGSRCRHHLCTLVGKHLVSTVGDMFDKNPHDDKAKKIGCDRTYETYVFKVRRGRCDCGCGVPDYDASNIDGLHANSAKTANANHMAMCRKYAAVTPAKKPVKKRKTLEPEPDCRKCHGTGGVRVRANTVSGYDTETCECIVKQCAPKPAKKRRKYGN